MNVMSYSAGGFSSFVRITPKTSLKAECCAGDRFTFPSDQAFGWWFQVVHSDHHITASTSSRALNGFDQALSAHIHCT